MNDIVVNTLKSSNFGSIVPKNIENCCAKIIDLMNYFKDEKSLKILRTFYERLFEDGHSDLNNLEEELKDTIVDDVLESYIFFQDENEVNYKIYELYQSIYKIVQLSRVKYNQKTNSYKVYPDFTSNYFKLDNKDELRYVLDIYFSYDKGISEIINIIKDTLNQESNKKIYDIKNGNLEPYCGNINFMKERSKYIVECIQKIILSENIDDSIKFYFQQYYHKVKELVDGIKVNSEMIDNSPNEYKYKLYDEIEEKYKKILQYEESLSNLMQIIWNDYLTDALEYSQGKPFKFMTHTLTMDYIGVNKMNRACCTLITNECIPVVYGNYGYIMDFDISQVGTMCNEDAGSWIISKDEFIERLFPSSWQMYEKVDDGYVWYEYPKLSKLIMPWDMESEMYKNNQNDHTNYTEIFMKSTDKPLTSTAFFAISEDGKNTVQKIKDEYNLNKPLLCLNEFSYSNNNKL